MTGDVGDDDGDPLVSYTVTVTEVDGCRPGDDVSTYTGFLSEGVGNDDDVGGLVRWSPDPSWDGTGCVGRGLLWWSSGLLSGRTGPCWGWTVRVRVMDPHTPNGTE